MDNYFDIKNEEQERTNKLLEDCKVFWAFSKEQFNKNKTKLKKGETYTNIGAGGFCESSQVDKMIAGHKEIEKWRKEELKKMKLKKNKAIKYELNNFECFCSGDITPVVELFEGIYTEKEILKVYNNK